MSIAPGSIQERLAAYGLEQISDQASADLRTYIDLLLRWNARVNLTAIRDAAGILERHVVESVWVAQSLSVDARTLLDFGSGAGVPGIPVALCRPEVSVLLAEAKTKKAAFLREAARIFDGRFVVHAGRVEELAAGRRFDVVTMRAVDRMLEMLGAAQERVAVGGTLLLMVTRAQQADCRAQADQMGEWASRELGGDSGRILLHGRRTG